jgi:hypothetical protein
MPESIWDAEVQNTLEAEERGSNTMANQEHLDILKQGVQIWNQWREEHPDIEPDLSKAALRGADLSEADLIGATLSKADLSGADLSKANLLGALQLHLLPHQ